MNCQETQRAFSPYIDGELAWPELAAIDSHLELCPVCRDQLAQTRALVSGLRSVRRPAAPQDLTASISGALQIERAARAANPTPALAERVTRWLQPHLMPYAVGAFYSVLLFVAVFGALRQQLSALRSLALAARVESAQSDGRHVTWVEREGGGYDVTKPLSPALYAATRSPYTAESPSLNPRGALARMTWIPSPSGRPDDDDMIVVADVFGNGRASLAAVVEPPRNPRALDDFQDALRKSPAFVPASFDGRPQTMRVVFVLQKMNVPDASY